MMRSDRDKWELTVGPLVLLPSAKLLLVEFCDRARGFRLLGTDSVTDGIHSQNSAK